ncbi:MAG: hypothetical protein MUE98_00115 [Rhodobacteraceae bacterium]|jgi:hypothetical protein|nr:hypothetical protein [Paracoccaceae bacterium]
MDPTTLLPDLVKALGPTGGVIYLLWWLTTRAPKPPPPPDAHEAWRAEVVKLLHDLIEEQREANTTLQVLKDRLPRRD